MKKIIIFTVISIFSLSIFAQSSKYYVLLIPLSDFVTVKINGSEIDLKNTKKINNIIEIEVLNGRVNVVDIQGNGTVYTEGNVIKVKDHIRKQGGHKRKIKAEQLSDFLIEPSIYLPNLCSPDRSFFVIFPKESNVCDKSNIKFYYPEDYIKNMVFKLYKKNSETPICQTNTPDKNEWLKNVTLNPGETYIWKLYNGSNSVKGKFTMLNKEQIQKIQKSPAESKVDYINNFISLLENECRFEARALLLKAQKQFPENELFKSMEKIMSTE